MVRFRSRFCEVIRVTSVVAASLCPAGLRAESPAPESYSLLWVREAGAEGCTGGGAGGEVGAEGGTTGSDI